MKKTKKHLIKFLQGANSNATKVELENIVLQIEAFMIDTLRKNDDFKFAGITIEKRVRDARKAANPKTQEEIDVPAKNTIRFKASKGLLKKIQD